MAEHAPLTKQERERLHTRIHTNVERALAEYDDDDWADMCMRGLGYILRYEATIAALEAELARLRPLAEVGEFAVDERRAYKRYMAGEYGDWLQKCGVARRGVWDTADAILAQEDDGE